MTTVTLRIAVDKSGASEGIGQVKRDLEGMGTAGAQGGQQAAGGMSALSGAINGAKAAVGAFVAAYAAVQTLTGVVRLADEYQGMSDRLRLATSSTAEFTAAQAGVFAIAQQTGSALGAVNDLYVGLSRSTEQLGLNQGQLLTITTAINQSFAVSGTNAASAEAATRQLGQAFASGVLRGDEFNSMMENAPGLASALATSLGVTNGELRKMAAEGQLTSDVLAKGLLQQAPAIAEQFGQMGTTVGRAFQQVSNAVLVAVGAFNESTGASASLAAQVSQLAGVISNIATLFVATGERSAAASDDVGVLTRAFQGIAIAAALVVNAVQAMASAVVGAVEGASRLVSGLAEAADAAASGSLDRTRMLLSMDFKGFVSAQLDATTAAFQAMGRGASDATEAVSNGLAGASAESADFSTAVAAILAPLGTANARTESLAGAMGALPPVIAPADTSLKEIAKAADAAAKAALGLAVDQEKLTAELGGPAVKAAIELAQRLRAVDDRENELRRTGQLSTQTAEALNAMRGQLIASYGREATAVQSLQNPYETYIAKLNDERRLLGLSAVERARAESQIRAVTAVMAFANAERARGNGLMIDEIEKLILLEKGLDATAAATGKAAQAAAGWQQYWTDAVGAVTDAFGDFVASGFKSFEDLKDGLINIAKQIVSDLVSTFLRSRITIPITAALSGGSGSALAGGLTGSSGGGFGGMLGGLLGGAGGLLGGGFGTGLLASGSIFSGAGLLGGITGSIGAGVSSIMGGSLLQGLGLLAGPIGLIGGAIAALTSLFSSSKPPDVRFGGDQASIRNREGRFSTVFGGVQAGSRQISYQDMIEPIQQFDLAIQGIVQATGGGATQLDAIKNALSTWEVDLRGSAATAENVLGSRFGAVLSAFSADVQGFVGTTGTLEERLSRFTDALSITAIAAGGTITSDFGELADLLTRFRVNGEAVGDTFVRLSVGMAGIDGALRMLGGTFNGTRLQAATFAGELIELAGGFDAFSARLNGALEALFTQDERNQFLADQAQSALNESLRGLNISGSLDSVRTQLRDQLRDAMAAGNSELVNRLLLAGNALGAFSTAIGNLGENATAAARGIVFGTSPTAGGRIGAGAGLTSPAGTSSAPQTQLQASVAAATSLQAHTTLLTRIADNTTPKTATDQTAKIAKDGSDASRSAAETLKAIKSLLEQTARQQTQESLKRTTGANNRATAA